jgi:shikimate kinase
MMMTSRKQTLIFLTGYMGAGKSTIGKKLAFKLRYRFTDTDKALEKQFKLSMSEIFSEHGEATFRKEEEALIEKLSRRDRTVVSTGGGTLTRLETFYTAQRSGILIYLSAPVETLYERVIFSQKDRPLVNQPNSKAIFSERFAKREPYYQRADVKINTDDRPSDEVVEEILQWLNASPSN